MADNTRDTWKIERLEMRGFGQRKGTNPKGARAQAFHVGSAPYPAATFDSSAGSYSSSSPSSGLGQSW